MIATLRALLTLAWSLWFGGMIALLIFVIQLFKSSHETGVIGAPVLFRTFASYQLVLGGVAVVLAGILLAARCRIRITLAFLVVSLLIAFPIRAWTMEIESLRAVGQNQSERFKTLHGRSRAAYTSSAVSLLIAGIALSFSGPARGARREETP